MSVTVLEVSECADIDFNKKEILRYMGCKASTREIDELIDKCIDECREAFRYRAVFCTVPVVTDGSTVTMGNIRTESRDLGKVIANCRSCVIFGATVGLEIDRLILKYGHLSPSKAVVFQAIGAERIETLCDTLCKRLEGIYGKLCPRFSAGYGDLSLELQKDIFSLLDCQKHIGLTLNDTKLMSPAKSVTAVVGIL